MEHLIWTREAGNTVTIGLRRDFVAAHEVSFIELLGVGVRVKQNGPIGLAQFTKGSEAEITSPIAGTITAVNAAVNCVDEPRLVNEDPEGAGWLVVVTTTG